MADIDWAGLFMPTTPALEIIVRGSVIWQRIVQAPCVQLVRDGRLIRRNLEQEKITEDELLAEIHAHGCENISDVRAAWIEPDGMASVIRLNGDADAGRRKRGAK